MVFVRCLDFMILNVFSNLYDSMVADPSLKQPVSIDITVKR